MPSETELGIVKGKPGYMSPEQCRCDPLDRRSDVFCIGILLYELTTGVRCFAANNEYLIAKRIMEEAPAPFAATYPAALAAIVERALAKDRRDRYPTALELQNELSAFATSARFDVSQFGLVRLMAELFADELTAWHEAQRAGQSLVEHVIKRTTLNLPAIAPAPTAPTQIAKITPGILQVMPVAPARQRRGPAVVAIVGVATALAIGGIVWQSTRSTATQVEDAPRAAGTMRVDAAVPATFVDAAVPATHVDATPPVAAVPVDAAIAVPRDAAPHLKQHRTPRPDRQLDDDTDPDNIIR